MLPAWNNPLAEVLNKKITNVFTVAERKYIKIIDSKSLERKL
jgi:hypothetical protein